MAVSFGKPIVDSIVAVKNVSWSASKTEFKSMLTEVIEDLSEQGNIQYALDEHCYNENDIKTYISIMARCTPENITKSTIKRFLWDIFMPIKNNGSVILVKRNNEDLVLNCSDNGKLCMLDQAYAGIMNNEIIEASRGFYISQNDEKLRDVPYGTSNLKYSGCGPISLTMALNYVNDSRIVSLEEVLKWAEENNMYEANAGTRWALIREFPSVVSAKCEELYISDYENFENVLSENEVLVTIMDSGHFTDNGHFIVITDIKDGKATVLDSVSIYRSLHKWDAKLVFDESKKYFWKISKREDKSENG